MTRTDDFIALARQSKCYSLDVEHAAAASMYQPDFELAGCGFATGDPLNPMLFYEEDMAEVAKICNALFPDPEVEDVAYNGKYDIKCLRAVKICDSYSYPTALRDPMVEVNLLDENRGPGDMGLKTVIYDQYGHQMMTYEEAASFGLKSPQFRAYACEDVKWEYRLHSDLKPMLVEQDLWKILCKIYAPMTLVAADMEWEGVGWDIDGAKPLLRGFQELRKQMENEIYAEIGQINLGSSQQIAKRLFGDLGYSTRGIGMTKSGKQISTASDAMEKLAKRYPVCDKIVKYRTASKMIGTYVEPLTRLALDDPSNRVHPTLWLISKTGRTRMEKPNFQNIPAWLDKSFDHLNIRKNIIARPGWKLIVADLSQIELRLCGHISGDRMFLKAYQDWQCSACGNVGTEASIIQHACPSCGTKENEDILSTCPRCKSKHVKTIKNKNREVMGCDVCLNKVPHADAMIKGFWHGLDLHQMTTDSIKALGGDRQSGKTCNFALIYLATAVKMHYEYPMFSIKQWEEIIYEFFIQYSGVKRWHVQMEYLMYNGGVVKDVFGRKRRIHKSEIQKSPKHAFNMFVNFPVQCSACKYMELAMARVRETCLELGEWGRTIIQSNFVHDEGVWECPEEMVPQYIPVIQNALENSVRFNVPIRTSITVCDRWGEAK